MVDPFEVLINPLIWKNAIREYYESGKTDAALAIPFKRHEDRHSIPDWFYWSYAEEADK